LYVRPETYGPTYVTILGMLWLAGVDVQSPDKRRAIVIPVLKQYVPKDIFNMDGIHSL